MFQFANSYILYFLLLIPAFIALYIYARIRRRKNIEAIGDADIIAQLMPKVSNTRPLIKFILILLAYTFIVLGLARPQFGSKLQEVKRTGIELQIVLDVSNSMNAQDIEPSRLERAKQAITKLVDKLHDDKIGLVVFAGEAYVQIPITTDYVSAKMFLSQITSDIVPVQGTAIGTAIELASRSYTPESQLQKAMIIITDGENHEDNAIEAAKIALEKGIVIHTLGMGLPQGAPIPLGNDGSMNFKKDQSGNVVMSKLDENALQEIAVAGGGIYVRANNSQVGLSKVFDKIEKMNKKEYDSKIYSDYEDQFGYFFAMALIFIIIEFFVQERKNKWMSSIKLFQVKK